jgi:hypothetical protein
MADAIGGIGCITTISFRSSMVHAGSGPSMTSTWVHCCPGRWKRVTCPSDDLAQMLDRERMCVQVDPVAVGPGLDEEVVDTPALAVIHRWFRTPVLPHQAPSA